LFVSHKIPIADNFLSSNTQWVPKYAEFYADSKSAEEIQKNCTNKKFFKKLARNSFLLLLFVGELFSSFCLQIWIQHKILCFLPPL